MHPALQLAVFWAIGFVTLIVAVVLLEIFSEVIDSDLTLHTIGREAAIAGVASLIEAASLWATLSFMPRASRLLFLPMIIVALIYQATHLEDWTRYDAILLLMFQIVLGSSGAALFFGHWELAMIIGGAFACCLALMVAIARSL